MFLPPDKIGRIAGFMNFDNSIPVKATFFTEKRKTLYIVYQLDEDGIWQCLCDLKREYINTPKRDLDKIDDRFKYVASYYPKEIRKVLGKRLDVRLLPVKVIEYGGMNAKLTLFGKTLPKDSYFSINVVQGTNIIRATIQAANATDWREITNFIEELAIKNKILKGDECLWDIEYD